MGPLGYHDGIPSILSSVGGAESPDLYGMLFPAKLTSSGAGTGALGGLTVYAWTEQTVQADGITYADADGARTGTLTEAAAVEANNLAVNTPTIVWLRQRGWTAGSPLYEFYAGAVAPASSSPSAWLQPNTNQTITSANTTRVLLNTTWTLNVGLGTPAPSVDVNDVLKLPAGPSAWIVTCSLMLGVPTSALPAGSYAWATLDVDHTSGVTGTPGASDLRSLFDPQSMDVVFLNIGPYVVSGASDHFVRVAVFQNSGSNVTLFNNAASTFSYGSGLVGGVTAAAVRSGIVVTSVK